MPPEQQTFVCLHPLEKEMTRGLGLIVSRPDYVVIAAAYDFLSHAVFQEQPEEREEAYRINYGISDPIPTGLPPPFDYVRLCDPVIWEPLMVFLVDEGAPYGIGCAFSNFDVDHSGLGRPLGT